MKKKTKKKWKKNGKKMKKKMKKTLSFFHFWRFETFTGKPHLDETSKNRGNLGLVDDLFSVIATEARSHRSQRSQRSRRSHVPKMLKDKKPRSHEAKKRKSQEAKKPRSQEATKPQEPPGARSHKEPGPTQEPGATGATRSLHNQKRNKKQYPSDMLGLTAMKIIHVWWRGDKAALNLSELIAFRYQYRMQYILWQTAWNPELLWLSLFCLVKTLSRKGISKSSFLWIAMACQRLRDVFGLQCRSHPIIAQRSAKWIMTTLKARSFKHHILSTHL